MRIHYGITDTILVSDLFYAKEYNLTFNRNDNLIVSYNPKLNTAIFQPKNNFIGAALVDFTLQGKQYCSARHCSTRELLTATAYISL